MTKTKRKSPRVAVRLKKTREECSPDEIWIVGIENTVKATQTQLSELGCYVTGRRSPARLRNITSAISSGGDAEVYRAVVGKSHENCKVRMALGSYPTSVILRATSDLIRQEDLNSEVG